MVTSQGACLDGVTSSESKHMLEDATTSLDEQAELSSRAVQALVESTTLLADISIASGSASSPEVSFIVGMDNIRHGLAKPCADYRSHVTGSNLGWSRSYFPYILCGC